MEPMWETSRQTMGRFIEFIYDHSDEFRLLISCSEQTAYEQFTHTLIDLDVDMTIRYLQYAKELGFRVNECSRQELHIIINAQFSCIFEMVLHEIPKSEALRMAERFSGFFSAGWRDFLGT